MRELNRLAEDYIGLQFSVFEFSPLCVGTQIQHGIIDRTDHPVSALDERIEKIQLQCKPTPALSVSPEMSLP